MERPLLIVAYHCEFQHTAAKVMSGAGGLSRRACGQGCCVELAGRSQARPPPPAFLLQFSSRIRYRGAGSGTLSARDQSARLHYQIAQPSRPEPCAQAVRLSKKPVLYDIGNRLLSMCR